MRRIDEHGLEIGYWVHADFVGRGFATCAAEALTTLGLSLPGVTHIEIHHDKANVVSGRIPRKLGFEMVGERTAKIEAPGETGVNLVWRIDRTGPPGRKGPGAIVAESRVVGDVQRLGPDLVPVNEPQTGPGELGHTPGEQVRLGVTGFSGLTQALIFPGVEPVAGHALGHADDGRGQYPLVVGVDVGLDERADRSCDRVVYSPHRFGQFGVVGERAVEQEPDGGLVVDDKAESTPSTLSRPVGVGPMGDSAAVVRASMIRTTTSSRSSRKSARLDLKCW